MRRSLSAVQLLVFILVPVAGLAGEGPIVAVFDLEDNTSTFDRAVLENLTEFLSVKLAEGGYQVIPREQVRERLVQEKKGTYRECVDRSCQIELGRELAAQKVLSARILKVAGRCQLAVSLYDLKKAASEKAASAEGECDEESMGRAALTVTARLTLPGEPAAAKAESPPPAKVPEVALEKEAAPAYSRWGHVTFWSGLGAAAFGAVTGLLAASAGDDYQAGDRSAYDRSVALAGCMYAGLSAGGALMITGIILWALDPGEDAPSVSVLPFPQGGMGFSLGGRF